MCTCSEGTPIFLLDQLPVQQARQPPEPTNPSHAQKPAGCAFNGAECRKPPSCMAKQLASSPGRVASHMPRCCRRTAAPRSVDAAQRHRRAYQVIAHLRAAAQHSAAQRAARRTSGGGGSNSGGGGNEGGGGGSGRRGGVGGSGGGGDDSSDGGGAFGGGRPQLCLLALPALPQPNGSGASVPETGSATTSHAPPASRPEQVPDWIPVLRCSLPPPPEGAALLELGDVACVPGCSLAAFFRLFDREIQTQFRAARGDIGLVLEPWSTAAAGACIGSSGSSSGSSSSSSGGGGGSGGGFATRVIRFDAPVVGIPRFPGLPQRSRIVEEQEAAIYCCTRAGAKTLSRGEEQPTGLNGLGAATGGCEGAAAGGDIRAGGGASSGWGGARFWERLPWDGGAAVARAPAPRDGDARRTLVVTSRLTMLDIPYGSQFKIVCRLEVEEAERGAAAGCFARVWCAAASPTCHGAPACELRTAAGSLI